MPDHTTVFDPAGIHLVLFLSRATPLGRWDSRGIFEREVALYRELALWLGSVSIVTSGGPEELAYQARLGNIRILYNRWGLSPNAYSLLAPILHWSVLRGATVYKTNQPDGSWTGVLAGMLHRKPVVVRAGYLWAELHRQEGGRGPKAVLVDCLQTFSFRRADAIILTTQAMKEEVVDTYRVAPAKIKVVPNYVDTETFCPAPHVHPAKGRIGYVGRLDPCKNLHLAIKAVSQIPNTLLVLIGDGQQRYALEALARELGADVRFAGVLPNEQIPSELNRCQAFVLVSSSEGHPKALIEAMACGTAVIGADSPGIRDLVRHGETGWLCKANVGDVQAAISTLLTDADLAEELGHNARQYVLKNFALDKVVEMELDVLRWLVQARTGSPTAGSG